MKTLPGILLVEDNEDDYEATMRCFKRIRFANPIIWKKTGTAALAFLEENSTLPNDQQNIIGLILLDINMPGIDGKQIVGFLKNDPRFKSLPIVILTTSSDPADVHKLYDLGVNTYIQKPLVFDGLAHAICTMNDYWFNVALLPHMEPS